jgi:hypothetical protein
MVVAVVVLVLVLAKAWFPNEGSILDHLLLGFLPV